MPTLTLALDIALAHLLGRRRQTLVSLLGVALGVGFYIGMSSMMQGFQRDFVARVIDTSPHIVIRDEYRRPPRQPADLAAPDGAVAITGVRPTEERKGIRQAGTLVAALAEEPGLRVAPVLTGQVFLHYGAKDVSATLNGIEPERERRVTNLEKDMVAGSLDDLRTTANGLILGDGVARKLGVGLGDTVTATSPAGILVRMKVVGVFRSGIVALDDIQAYALLKRVQVLMDRPEVVNGIRIKLDDVTRARDVAAGIEARIGYRSESWEESNANILGIFVIQNAIIYSTVGAILTVACFGIFNIISTVIHEKARDIAILKSIGFSEGVLQGIFVLQGVLVGCAGVVCGWALGYGLVEFLGSLRFSVDGFVRTEGFVLYRSWTHYAIGGAVSLAAAVLAAYLPARRAARLNPVDIVRGAA